MSDIEDILEQAANMDLSKMTSDEILDKYRCLRISANNPIEKPETIIKIQGIEICSPGNLVMVSGPEKSAKTSFLNVLLSACIVTSNGYDGSDKIEIKSNTGGNAIIVIDTEQSEYHSYRNFSNAILRRAGIEREPDHFYYYNIRSLSLSEYQPLLTAIFRTANEKHGGILLCAIDGGADFVSDTNDIKESTAKVAFFSQLAMKYNTGIIQVVHLNPGSDKERGHYGSELRRKCESVLSIKKDGDISVIEGKLLRSGGIANFQPMRFKYDQAKGYHVFLDGHYTGNKEVKLNELAENVFVTERTYSDAVKLIAEYEGCTDRTAKSRISKLAQAGIIIRNEDKDTGVLYALKSK